MHGAGRLRDKLLLIILIHVPGCIFISFYYNPLMHNYLIEVYIRSVSLCDLHSYIFRHFRVIIRQSTANALLSYTRFSNYSC